VPGGERRAPSTGRWPPGATAGVVTCTVGAADGGTGSMSMHTWRGRARWRHLVWALPFAATLSWAVGRGPATVVEVLVLAAVVGGLIVSLREPARARTSRPVRPDPDPRIADVAARALDRLDGIEHRRVELGTPWPAVVVGPTGIHLVDVCPVAAGSPARCTGAASAAGCERCVRNARITRTLQRQLASEAEARPVPVRTVAVVAADAAGRGYPAPDDGAGRVEVVPVDRLPDALARGPVLPMADVDRAFRALAVLTVPAGAPPR
jgi:hypothetical protein